LCSCDEPVGIEHGFGHHGGKLVVPRARRLLVARHRLYTLASLGPAA
jgi:hypothetical protein